MSAPSENLAVAVAVLTSATIRSGRDEPDEPGRSPRSVRSRSS